MERGHVETFQKPWECTASNTVAAYTVKKRDTTGRSYVRQLHLLYHRPAGHLPVRTACRRITASPSQRFFRFFWRPFSSSCILIRQQYRQLAARAGKDDPWELDQRFGQLSTRHAILALVLFRPGHLVAAYSGLFGASCRFFRVLPTLQSLLLLLLFVCLSHTDMGIFLPGAQVHLPHRYFPENLCLFQHCVQRSYTDPLDLAVRHQRPDFTAALSNCPSRLSIHRQVKRPIFLFF